MAKVVLHCEGMENANIRKPGNKPLPPSKIARIKELLDQIDPQLTYAQIAKMTKVSIGSVSKYRYSDGSAA